MARRLMCLVQRTVSGVLDKGCCHYRQGQSYSKEVTAIDRFNDNSAVCDVHESDGENQDDMVNIKNVCRPRRLMLRKALMQSGVLLHRCNGCAEAHASHRSTSYAELGSNLAKCSTEDAGTQALTYPHAGWQGIQADRILRLFTHLSSHTHCHLKSCCVSSSVMFLFVQKRRIPCSWVLFALATLAIANTSY